MKYLYSREAIAAFQSALRYRPHLARAHLSLGTAYEKSGDRAGAEAAYRRLIALAPDDLHAYNQLGNLLWERGDRSAAAAMLEKALEIDPAFAMAHHNLALLYREMKEMDRWHFHGRRFLELETENSAYARRIRSLLEER